MGASEPVRWAAKLPLGWVGKLEIRNPNSGIQCSDPLIQRVILCSCLSKNRCARLRRKCNLEARQTIGAETS